MHLSLPQKLAPLPRFLFLDFESRGWQRFRFSWYNNLYQAVARDSTWANGLAYKQRKIPGRSNFHSMQAPDRPAGFTRGRGGRGGGRGRGGGGGAPGGGGGGRGRGGGGGGRGRGGSCHTCGEDGHFAKNCPNGMSVEGAEEVQLNPIALSCWCVFFPGSRREECPFS